MSEILSKSKLFAYGSLGVPLAFVGLPIYIYLPHYYATTHGLSLALIGVIMLLLRLFDAIADPFIGYYSDKLKYSRRNIILFACLPLAIGFIALFSPPNLGYSAIIWWLIIGLLITYTAFSVVLINYYAASTELPQSQAKNTVISGVRESAMMLGVIIAAALPALLQKQFPQELAFRYFALSFLPLIIGGTIAIYWVLPKQKIKNEDNDINFSEIKKLRPLFPLYLLFFINSLATGITSTLFLFFVEDYLQVPDESGYMLLCFFASSAASVPIWVWLSAKIGSWQTLRIGMIIAILAFFACVFLRAGDVWQFYAICAITGIAISADLTLLPAIFTNAIRNSPKISGSAFSIWHFLAKINLALAAGLILPSLQYLGYQPAMQAIQDGDANYILLIFYAVIPCIIKLFSLMLTFSSKVKQSQI